MARRASASGATTCRRGRSFSRRPPASPTPRSTTSRWRLGGPIVKDRWHYYGAYEYVDRSLITGNQVITVSPTAAQTLGLDLPADGVIPAHQKVNFLFGKTDYQINGANRLSARYFLFKNFSLSNIAGGLTTTDRATDFTDRMDSASAQLISTIGSDKLSELRVQYARRHQFRTLSDTAADGPAITVTGVANFGGPRIGDTNAVGFDFNQGIWQVIENLTWMRGKHSYKAGVDAQFIADDRVRGERFFYTFPTNDAYLGARERGDAVQLHVAAAGLRRSRRVLQFRVLRLLRPGRLAAQLAHEAAVRHSLRPLRRAVGAGVRVPIRTRRTSRSTRTTSRRASGFSWSLDERATTVLRASIGLMYEPPLIDFYDNAILNNGDPRAYTVSVSGTAAGAPPYPTSLANVPAGFVLPRQSITAVDTDFATQSAWLTNVQLERAAAQRHVGGRRLRQLHRPQPAGADGRQPDSDRTGARRRAAGVFDDRQRVHARRPDVRPRERLQVDWRVHLQRVHRHVQQAHDERLAGAGHLHARARRGQRAAHRAPTWSAAATTACPIRRTSTATWASRRSTRRTRSWFRPSSRRRSPATGLATALANNNQVGLIMQANSGLPFNIRSNQDLNRDGVTNDRPLDIDRNTGRLGRVVYLDLRYSRFIPLPSEQRIELFFEAKNLFNTENVSGVNRVVTTDAAGNPSAPLPDPFPPTSGYDQRQMQVGIKFVF